MRKAPNPLPKGIVRPPPPPAPPSKSNNLNLMLIQMLKRWENEVSEFEKTLELGANGRDDGSFDDGKYNMLLSCIDDVYTILSKK